MMPTVQLSPSKDPALPAETSSSEERSFAKPSSIIFSHSFSPIRLTKRELLDRSRELTSQISRWLNVPWVKELAQSAQSLPIDTTCFNQSKHPLVLIQGKFKFTDYKDLGDGELTPQYHSIFRRYLRIQSTLDGLSLKITRASLYMLAKERGILPNQPLEIKESLLVVDADERRISKKTVSGYAIQGVFGKCVIDPYVRSVGILKRPETTTYINNKLCPDIFHRMEVTRACYFKPDNACGGEGVFKVTRDASEKFRFESNCGINASILRDENQSRVSYLRNVLSNFFAQARPFFRIDVGPSHLHPPVGYSRVTVDSSEKALVLAQKLISQHRGHPNWIMEAAIPIERARGRLIEFRFVFDCSHAELMILRGHYAKASGAVVAGNLAMGGSGISTDDAIARLVQQRWPTLGHTQRNRQCLTLKNELIDTVETFTNRFVATYAPNGIYGKLAVDVVPVWNEPRKKYDWFLMEINAPRHGESKIIGISGMPGYLQYNL